MTERDAEAFTDRSRLRRDLYRDEAKLEARRAIYAYTTEGGDFVGPAIGALAEAETVLDVGCGPGVWHDWLAAALPSCDWLGVDLSEGMAATAARHGRTPVGTADAVALPLADDVVDGALSVHMLYHVPVDEQRAALEELRRVVRNDGPVVVTTNARDHLVELDDLLASACHAIGVDVVRLGSTLSFVLDDGEELLGTVFDEVRTVHADGRLAVTDADVVAGYIASLGAVPGSDDAAMSALIDVCRHRALEAIDRTGSFDVRTHAGVFVCRA